MADQGEIPSVIFCSTFVRAVQTADIYGTILKIRVNKVDDLTPNRPLDDRLLELMGHKELKGFMILGHHDNTTPAFNRLRGKMADEKRDDDDDLRKALGYTWGTQPGDGDQKGDTDGDWVPLVMCEVRRLRIDRDTGEWKVKWRLRPSDLGRRDY